MSTMSLDERKERLSAMARTEGYHRQLHASDVITAIDTLNKMDNLYKQQGEPPHDVVHTFIFVLPSGTRFIPGLPERAASLHNEIVEGEIVEND